MILAQALRLERASLTVPDLAATSEFYVDALGFVADPAHDADPALATLLGARAVRLARLHRGRQTLELAEFDPPGAPYPADSASNDRWFQHCALVTDDIGAAFDRLRNHAFTPISRDGPQPLPGGIVAYKFRDPAGHPLELIQFPAADPRTAGGIDHAAIAVGDAATSIAFYRSRLGLSVQSHQVNVGPAQDALDDLSGATVDVVALAATVAAPHLELLGYRAPPGRPASRGYQGDLAASRLVFSTAALPMTAIRLADERRALLIHDPDEHAILLIEDAASA